MSASGRLALPLLVLAICFLAASAVDYTSYYDYQPPAQKYKYYVAYCYYKKGYYKEDAGKYFDYYYKTYHQKYYDWYGDDAKGIYGYKYGVDPKYNPGYTKWPGSWGGYAYFYSYYDAYNFFWNPKYGLYSGYYDYGPWSYQTGFKGVVPGVGSTPDATGLQIRGADVAPAPADIQTVF